VARDLGLEALFEVHSVPEAARAVDAGARIVGVNHRDLDTLAIDLALSERLAGALPETLVKVAESGLRAAEDLRRVAGLGYQAVLVGEALMRAPAPGAALARLRGRLPCG
jgi:indole-3-glycerol phosphate synthase